MIIRWIGQSGYIIKSGTTEIMIDPYLSDVVNRVAGRPRTVPAPFKPCEINSDAVICSHDHLDHIDIDSIPEMPKGIAFFTTHGGKEKIESLGQKNVTALGLYQTVKIGDFEVTTVFADHTVEAFGIVLKAENKVLYFSGDTLFNEKLFDIAKYKPDLTFICINGKLGNMDVEQAITVANYLGAKVNIPNHYDMFASNSENPLLFTENISGGKVLEFNKEYFVEELLGE